MRVIPAVDVMDHKVVQLVGGVPGSQQIVIPDPVSVAEMWIGKGADYLHLVDLDAAFDKESNIPVFKRIIEELGVPAEVGGGIRSTETVDELVSAGADRIVVGTKAVKEPEWLAEIADRHPGRIVLSMDTKGGSNEKLPTGVDAQYYLNSSTSKETVQLTAVANENIPNAYRISLPENNNKMLGYDAQYPTVMCVSASITGADALWQLVSATRHYSSPPPRHRHGR